MNKQLTVFLALSFLLVGSFLGTYLGNHPLGGTKDPVVEAKGLIDGAAGDQSKLAHASDLLRRALVENPDNLLALFLEGRALQQRGLLDKALESYKRYFERSISTDFAANYNAAELYELKGDLQNAERHFRDCITAAPKEGVGWERLIRLLLRQNRVQEAKDLYSALVRQAPGSTAVKNLSSVIPQ